MENKVNEATASQEQGFVPMQIGEPDYAAMLETENHYEAICKVLNDLMAATREVVFLGKDLSIDEFFHLVESKEAERWCYRQHITAAELSFQNMDLEQVINLKLFKINNLDRVMQLYGQFKNLKNKQVKFDYPLRKLYVADKGEFSINNSEDVNEHFYTDVEKRFSIYTETEDQNKVLKILNEIADSCNKLAALGVLRPKNGILEMDVVSSFFNLNKLAREDSPFKVNSYVFRRHNRLYSYRTKKEITV